MVVAVPAVPGPEPELERTRDMTWETTEGLVAPEVAFDFSGQVVLVTGGTRGIGRGIVEAFRAAGALVVACGRQRPPDGWVDHDNLRFFALDVRSAEAAPEAVAAATGHFGRLDVLVNNAGGSPPADAANASPRFSQAIVDLNLMGPLHLAQAANAVMQTQDSGGSIVNITSISGLRPSPGTAAYGAAKAGLINLTQSLAIEWAPKVRLNCISAGLVATEAADDHYGGVEGMAEVAATVPLGRFGTPADVAGMCLLLASPWASYVTGANLVVHGGGERPAFLQAAERSHGAP